MNRALADAVVDLIGDPSIEAAMRLEGFSNRDWRRTNHWLITSGLALQLLVTLRQLRAENVLPPERLARLTTLYDASGARTAELRRDLLDLNRRFTAAGATFVNWKGFALEPDFCPTIRLRPQVDFDFIAAPESEPALDAALREAGYQRTDVYGTERRYENSPGSHYTLEEVYVPKAQREVEVHLGSDMLTRSREVGRFHASLERRVVRNIDGVSFPVLSPEDAFLSHAAHAGKHALRGWVRLGWLLELETFLRNHRANDGLWQRVRAQAEPGSITHAAIALAMLQTLWGHPMDQQLGWALDALPASLRRWIELNGRSFLMSDFPGTKLHLFMQRELMSATEWQRVERAALFPARAPRVARVTASSSTRQRLSAELTQWKFVLKRARFHLVESGRYLLAKRGLTRSVIATVNR